MAPDNVTRPRTSIIKPGPTLGTKTRDPLVHRLGADSEIPSHGCGRLATHDRGNDKRAAVRACLSIGVQLHGWSLSRNDEGLRISHESTDPSGSHWARPAPRPTCAHSRNQQAATLRSGQCLDWVNSGAKADIPGPPLWAQGTKSLRSSPLRGSKSREAGSRLRG